MNAEDVAQVQRRTLQMITEHFERVMMPDEEFIPLTFVVISAGASLLHEAGVHDGEVRKFVRQLNEEVKGAWLASCARHLDAGANVAVELALAGKEYDRILKKCARRK